MRIVLLGPPGAGKGTQATRVSSHFSVPHISTGDLFRAEIAAGTDLGSRAKRYTNAGELVPDEIVLEMVAARLGLPDAEVGFLLDGFPRTDAQAEALEARFRGDAIDVAVLIELDEKEVIRRLSGRWVCSNTKCPGVFHGVSMLPAVEGICDVCGSALVQRNDDQPEAIGRRLDEYYEKTAPVIDYYEGRAKLTRVDGVGEIDEVAGRIEQAIDAALSL